MTGTNVLAKVGSVQVSVVDSPRRRLRSVAESEGVSLLLSSTLLERKGNGRSSVQAEWEGDERMSHNGIESQIPTNVSSRAPLCRGYREHHSKPSCTA
mmetsp:Transcript_18334/g.38312  ORF Transcript_18334/g.38312 Transcript_18334/m.38312 type:complete len:98 (+) Transcript_18334:151-444(+)